MLEETTEELRRCVCERLNTTLEQVERDVDSLHEWLKTQPHLPQCSSKELRLCHGFRKMLEETTEELRRCVCERLNTTLEQVERDVDSLHEWLKTQPHLPQCSSKTMLTTFFVASKNRLERSKEKIDSYYTARSEMPEFFGERDPTDDRFKEISKEIRMFFLPKLSPDGCRVTMVTFATGDVKKYNVPVFVKRALMQEDVKMNREAFNTARYFVLDGARFSVYHVTKLSPKLCMQMITCAQNVLPVNIKAVIFINAPAILDIVLSIIRPFTKSKLFQRFHVHNEGPEVLEKYFPKSMLPRDYGGEEEVSEILNDNWLKCLEESRHWFLNEGSLKVQDSKRKKAKPTTNKPTTYQDTQGSFKNFCVD